MTDEIMTREEWASLSAASRAVINRYGKEHEELRTRAERAEAALKEISSLTSFRHGDDENLIGPPDEENDNPFEYTIKRIFEILDAHDGADVGDE